MSVRAVCGAELPAIHGAPDLPVCATCASRDRTNQLTEAALPPTNYNLWPVSERGPRLPYAPRPGS